jgi:threonine dehydrogenase-like Zn-dependent dehydrogenase
MQPDRILTTVTSRGGDETVRLAEITVTFNPWGNGPSALPYAGARDEARYWEPDDPAEEAMRALVYHGPGQEAWEEVPDLEILDDGDVIVRVDATTICGTDLHILKGDVPAVRNGRILGHEAVGTVWEAGDGIRRFSPGDRVLVSCISACGSCQFCGEARYGQCLEGGGWVLGADVTVNSAREDPLAVIRDLTGRLGADVSIEAVGAPRSPGFPARADAPGPALTARLDRRSGDGGFGVLTPVVSHERTAAVDFVTDMGDVGGGDDPGRGQLDRFLAV